MPRSRSISIETSTCSFISRDSSPPVIWISRSASVDFPWSICAMIAKLRMWSSGVVMEFLGVGGACSIAPEDRKAARGPRLFRLCGHLDEERPHGLHLVVVHGVAHAAIDAHVHCGAELLQHVPRLVQARGRHVRVDVARAHEHGRAV